MKNKVIYILSLSHSGSTLLDLILGCHDKIIGLGEIWQLMMLENLSRREISNYPCACNKKLKNCPFWSNIIFDKLYELESFHEKYKYIFKKFWYQYGQEKILVDSSKYLAPLRILCNIHEIDLYTIFLIRDVRSYTISQIDTALRKKKKPKKWSNFSIYKSWYKQNIIYKKFLKENEINYLQIGYEELTLYPEHTIKNILNFLSISNIQEILNLNYSNSHTILGNRMLNKFEKKSQIKYDNRWFTRREWIYPYIFYPKIRQFNKNEVYGNNTENFWKD